MKVVLRIGLLLIVAVAFVQARNQRSPSSRQTSSTNKSWGSDFSKAESENESKDVNFDDSLKNAFAPNADWNKILSAIDDRELKSAADAEALCRALDRLLERKDLLAVQKDGKNGMAYRLAVFFQQAEAKPAIDVLKTAGIPRLERLFDVLYEAPKKDTQSLFFIMKMLTHYQGKGGADRVLLAIKDRLKPDDYMWTIVMDGFSKPANPESQRVFNTLRENLPYGLTAIAVLDAANQYFIAGGTGVHPFDTLEGHKKLEAWLRAKKTEDDGYAHSATAALPFIEKKTGAELIEVALAHTEMEVRLEGAWALVKTGNEEGIKLIAKACMDIHHSKVAQAYLTEMKRVDAIPAGCREPDFAAGAEMSSWLQYPTEFGRAPDKLELFDKRELFWPPTNDSRKLWLFKFTFISKEPGKDPSVGVGMVGSTTFALGGETKQDMKPEAAYAVHCAWELQQIRDPRAPKERTVESGMAILKTYNPGFGE